MLEFLFILYMAAAARMSGGGLGAAFLNKRGDRDENGKDKGGVMPVNLSFLPEVAFGLGFGWGLHQVVGGLWFPLLAAAWSYAWMETGHGAVLQWGNDPAAAQGTRRHALTPVVDFLARCLGYEIGSRAYCRLFMAVKGFLIGLPVGGLPLAALWPLAYESKSYTKNHALTETLSGAFAAIAILLFINLGG
jgi:hypothetical protein